jgi:hypothetical protein
MAEHNEAKQIDSVTDYVEDKEDTNLQSGLSALVAATSLTRSPAPLPLLLVSLIII